MKIEAISQETLRADFEAREQLKNGVGVQRRQISIDSTCGNSSLWIFDSNVISGGSFPFNHEICIFRNGVNGCVDLKQYVRYCTYFWGPFGVYLDCREWAWPGGNSIGSFWAGPDSGFFGFATACEAPDLASGSLPFSAWQWVENAQQIPGLSVQQTVCMCDG